MNEQPHHPAPYEEISEKKTTKLGYALLMLMILCIIQVCQAVFRDLEKIPSRPAALSFCAGQMQAILSMGNNNPYWYDNYSANSASSADSLREQRCAWSKYEEQAGVKQWIVSLYPKLSRHFALKAQLETINNQINEMAARRDRSASNYTLSLEEQQAQVPGMIDRDSTSQSLAIENKALAGLEAQKLASLSESEQLLTELKQHEANYKVLYDEALRLHQRDNAWYQFTVFLLMSVFILPFFAISLRKYFSYKRINSPYTIIAAALVFATAILSLQVTGVFLYEILPRHFIELFLSFFKQFIFLRYVAYYGLVLLIIFLFGGIVYYIQKKIFSPGATAIRYLKDRKCPRCAFSIDLSMNYCPKCAHQLRMQCAACQQPKFKDLPVCEHCGHY